MAPPDWDERADADDADDEPPIEVAVVTISSQRSLDEDRASSAVVEAFETAGHELTTRERIRSEYDTVQSTVSRLVGRDDVEVVATTGSVGVEPDDVTIEAVGPLVDKELPAFVDLFHRLSYDAVGTGVICTRTLGGIADGVPIFCLPGSEAAARLGATDIIVPEARRLVSLANGTRPDS